MQERIKKFVPNFKLLILLLIAYILGIFTLYFRLPPVQILSAVKNHIQSWESQTEYLYSSDTYSNELTRFVFTEPAIERTLLGPVDSFSDILKSNKDFFVTSEKFYKFADKIEILNYEQFTFDRQSVIKINFSHKDYPDLRSAYMYGDVEKLNRNINAALIIPGTGNNQSFAIYRGDITNYHCCLAQNIQNIDVFIQIKPNEGIRAISNGEAKINADSYVNWHLNEGGSYSASYILEAAALTYFLKSNYQKTALLGLSQGGIAALISSYLSKPDLLIMSSGYSILSDLVEWAGHQQIIIPGIKKIVNQQYVKELDIPILLTYGRQEVGLYKIEAEEEITCSHFLLYSHIECIIHDGGHIFPEQEISDFLSNNFNLQ